MKRLAFIMILQGLLLFPVSALAAGDQLAIDNVHIYEGMNTSYSGGYTPTVADGRAVIILPLIDEGAQPVTGGSVTATLELGSTADSPFVYANYEKTVGLGNHSVDGGAATASCYLVRFEIPLAARRYMGTYPVTIRVRYGTAAGDSAEQSFTVYVTITDGIDPNATPVITTPKPDNPRPQPKIIVSRYAVSPSMVMAGEDFSIDVTLLNTETTWHTKNIVVTFSGETADILPAGGTDTFYIDEIADEESYELTLHLTTRLDAEPRPQKVALTIQYEDSARSSYTVTEEIWIEIRQPIRLELDEVSIPDTVSAGDSLPVTLQVFNMGKSTLYNVLCTLQMPGVIPEGAAYLGNMDSGTSATAEIYSFFGTLDMGDYGLELGDKDNKYGPSQGTMIVTWEDEYGESYEKTVEVSTVIDRPVFEDAYNQDEEPEEEPQRASQWWVSVVLLAGIATIVYGTLSYRRKVSKLKREYGDEDL